VRAGTSDSEVMAAFLTQHYFKREVARDIVVNLLPDEQEWLERGLTDQAMHKVQIRARVRGYRQSWLELAAANASEAIAMRVASNAGIRKRLTGLAEVLELEAMPERIECFDISHMQGDATVASCVVYGMEGALKSHYRRFNIKSAVAGDDVGAIGVVVSRR
jgi:excinuclease ABC subunit C